MPERGKPASRKAELQQSLDGTGIPVYSGGFDLLTSPYKDFNTLTPVLAIWRQSEIPTPDEIETIRSLAGAKISRFSPSIVEGLTARGATMVTLFKSKGTWKFRRMGWGKESAWSQLGALEEIAEEL